MSYSLALESKSLLEDLYALLQLIDPSRFRMESAPTARQLMERILAQARSLLTQVTASPADARMATLGMWLGQLTGEVEAAEKRLDAGWASLKEEWDAIRKRLAAAYEEMASSLRAWWSIRVPQLRPTNYARSLYHAANGVLALLLIQHVLTPASMIGVMVAFAGWAWSMEAGRRVSPGLNRLLMRAFGPMAHPHEWHRVNSATWYATALLILALTMTPLACSVAVIVLGIADPMAALIGRRWGRIRLAGGKSVEGALAFAGSGTLAAWGALAVYHPEISWPTALVVAAGAAIPAALAEVRSTRLDDNFTIPLAAGGGATLSVWLLSLV